MLAVCLSVVLCWSSVIAGVFRLRRTQSKLDSAVEFGGRSSRRSSLCTATVTVGWRVELLSDGDLVCREKHAASSSVGIWRALPLAPLALTQPVEPLEAHPEG